MNRKRLFILILSLGLGAWSGLASKAMSDVSLLPKPIPQGWSLVEGPRTFTKASLFEHIDGQAELFFKYGFQKSIFAVFKDLKHPEKQIDLDIYSMGDVLHAFGIFSRLRNEERPGGVGLDSYFDDRSALFYKGKYFVMLYATEENLSVLGDLARSISSKISDRSPAPREIGFFPKVALKPGSIQYFSEGLLGHQFLRRGFQGIYVNGDRESSLFLALFKSPPEAQVGLGLYKDYLLKKGKISPEGSPSVGLRGEDPYQGQVIVIQKGSYLIGVVGAEVGDTEERFLKSFIENIR
jgi:Family of unknown function (DUF6599)